MKERITTLPKWVLTGTNPAFYDMDSKTAVEQTARVYGKMSELVEDYNKFADELNLEVTNLVNGTTKDMETFITNLNKITHDYIEMLDNKTDVKIQEYEGKIKEQDVKLEQAVNYMTENLSEYVTDVTGDVIETMVNEQVAISLGEYETRVSTLEKTSYKLVYNEQTEELNLLKEVAE